MKASDDLESAIVRVRFGTSSSMRLKYFPAVSPSSLSGRASVSFLEPSWIGELAPPGELVRGEVSEGCRSLDVNVRNPAILCLPR